MANSHERRVLRRKTDAPAQEAKPILSESVGTTDKSVLMHTDPPNKEGRDIAILILGVGLGVLPWLLDKWRVEMPELLVFALLFLSVVLIIWSLIHLGWLQKLPYLSSNVSVATAILLCMGVATLSLIWHVRHRDSLEENLKSWVYSNGLGIERTIEAECSFSFIIRPPNGATMWVCRLAAKGMDRYIEIRTLVAPLEDQKIVDGWPPEKRQRLINALILEIARTKVNYELVAQQPEYKGIRLRRALPINTELNEQTFLEGVMSIEDAIILCQGQYNIVKNGP
jgi:hypothetical protein